MPLTLTDSVIHRKDYHQILFEEAKQLGVVVCFSTAVDDIFLEGPQILLSSGETISGDIVIGADGKLQPYFWLAQIPMSVIQGCGRKSEMPFMVIKSSPLKLETSHIARPSPEKSLKL